MVRITDYTSLMKDCQLYLNMDGDATDKSGNGNDGTVSGATLTTDRFSNPNHAYDFVRASSQYISVPHDSINLDSFVWSSWVKFDNNSTRYNLWGNWTGTNKTQMIYFGDQNKQLRMLLYTSSSQSLNVTSNNNVITDTNYHLVTFVRDSQTSGKIYIDGVDVTYSSTQTGSAVSVDQTTTYIGQVGDSTNFLDGVMDDFLIIKRALSVDEVKILYQITKNKYLYPTSEPAYEELFDDCVLYLDMNGDAKDVSNNNNDGTVTGATLTTDRFGLSNRAYSFDGTDDYITLTNSITFSGVYTASMWVKINSFDTHSYAMLFSNSSTSAVYLCVRDLNGTDNLTINYGNGEKLMSLTTDIVGDGSWHHIVVVRDSSGVNTGYIDGTALSTTQTESTSFSFNELARYYNTTGYNLNGIIDNAMLFTRALSADEVKILYQLMKSKYIYPYPKGVTE